MFSDRFVKYRAWTLLLMALPIFPLVVSLALMNEFFKSVYRPRKSIAGEIALVTGGGNGLGKHIAFKLAEQGCHVAVVDIDEMAAQDTAEHILKTYNVKAKAYKTDVGKFNEVLALSNRVAEELGPVTILINNAGVMLLPTSADTPIAEIENMVATNLTANIWTVAAFLDNMRKLGKGHIVGIGSLSGVIQCPRQIVYTATKYGLRGFMSSLPSEFYALNCEFIKTTHVVPFFLNTNPTVVDVRCESGHQMFPPVSGEQAAEIIIEGICTNKMQVFIPSPIGVIYRLLEFLPKNWSTNMLNRAVGYEVMKRIPGTMTWTKN